MNRRRSEIFRPPFLRGNMVYIRNFTEEDIPALQEERYADMTYSELKKLISDWNTKKYNGAYFEMFAICSDGIATGTVSLYQHTENTVSVGTEVFEKYRKKGLGTEGTRLCILKAKEQEYKYVSARLRTDNTASLSIVTKLGFSKTGQTVNQKGYPVYNFILEL